MSLIEVHFDGSVINIFRDSMFFSPKLNITLIMIVISVMMIMKIKIIHGGMVG